MRKKFLTILFTFIPLISLFAEPMTIPEMVDIALCKNPQTRNSWWQVRSSVDRVGIQQSNYYPNLSLVGQLTRGGDMGIVNGAGQTMFNSGANLVLNYLLMDCGERKYSVEAAKAALVATQWQNDWVLQSVMQKVISSAYSVLKEEEALAARLASYEESQEALEAVEELYRNGLKAISDVYTIKASINDMQIKIAVQKAAIDIAKGGLLTSMGSDIDETIEVKKLEDPRMIQTEGIHCLVAMAKEKRADLMERRAKLDQSRASYASVWANSLPKVNATVSGGYNQDFHHHDRNSQYQGFLSLDFPLFTGFQATYERHAAYAETQMAESQLEQLELDIALEVLTYSRQFQAAQEVLSIAYENVDNSFKSYEGVLEKYKLGKDSIFDLTDAQTQLVDARLILAHAKIEWYRSLAQLAYATGTISKELP